MKLLKYTILIIGTIIALFPFYWMIITALSSHSWISSIFYIPNPVTFDSFRTVLTNHPFIRWTLNSFIVAGIGSIGNVFISAIAAFSFACLDFKGNKIIFYAMLTTLALPGFLLVIPRFLLMGRLGWINTYQGVFVLWFFQMFSVFLLRQYFLGIPDEVMEAARIDGANLWQIFWKIIIPLGKPALIALMVITFLRNWNSLLWPLVTMNKTSMQTLSVGMSGFADFYQADFGKIMAGSILSLIPIFILFIFLQKNIESGIKIQIRR